MPEHWHVDPIFITPDIAAAGDKRTTPIEVSGSKGAIQIAIVNGWITVSPEVARRIAATLIEVAGRA